MPQNTINVVGGGLAGCEAALQIASRGLNVTLFEMRPKVSTPAHATDRLAELVCSNSFGSLSEHTAPWILKRELRAMGSQLLALAETCAVPAGRSLALDRVLFAEAVTQKIQDHPRIRLAREEFSQISENDLTIIATGPLTSESLARSLAALLGQESLYFYDAISPIVSSDSLNFDKMFSQSRYDKGEPDFWNIPLDRDQYDRFIGELLKGDVVLPHNFEKAKYFEGCMPIEALAERGPQTLSFGPMKPVGLTDPKTGRRPYAVIQLRAENQHRTAYNLVGFQTKLKYPEQERIFRTLPGLENAEFLRLGSMHRNSYINSPQHLLPTLQLRVRPSVFIGGQLTGTEGYVESIATGLMAGVNAANIARDRLPVFPPNETMIGALLATISDRTRKDFQPTNSNMGLFPALPPPAKGKRSKPERNELLSRRAQETFDSWIIRESCKAECHEPSDGPIPSLGPGWGVPLPKNHPLPPAFHSNPSAG